MEMRLECPHCGSATIDLHDYESMIVITTEYALFSVHCPVCGNRISCVRPIPEDMHDEVLYAAIEVGAGMGLST